MKPSFRFVLWLLPFLVLSCQSEHVDEKKIETQMVGTWQLAEIISHSMIAGQPDQTTKPSVDEFYHFYSDNTFKRTRSSGYEATGTYAFKEFSADESGVLLTFDSKDLCFHEVYNTQVSHPQEIFIRQTGTTSISESYIAADGPTYRYEKILRVD